VQFLTSKRSADERQGGNLSCNEFNGNVTEIDHLLLKYREKRTMEKLDLCVLYDNNKEISNLGIKHASHKIQLRF